MFDTVLTLNFIRNVSESVLEEKKIHASNSCLAESLTKKSKMQFENGQRSLGETWHNCSEDLPDWIKDVSFITR